MRLLVCESCRRQYDVSGLRSGSQVRCHCEALLEVDEARLTEVIVAGLTCGHCGAPIEDEAETCGHCAARLDEDDFCETLLCPACGKRTSGDALHCGDCGTGLADQSLRPLPPDETCPRCAASLSARALPYGQVTECTDCRGLFLSTEDFDEFCERSLQDPTASFADGGKWPIVRPLFRRGRRKRIACLLCGRLMHTRNFEHLGRPSGIWIDVCLHDGVWLDAHELPDIIGFLRANPFPRTGAKRKKRRRRCRRRSGSLTARQAKYRARARARRRAQRGGHSWWQAALEGFNQGLGS